MGGKGVGGNGHDILNSGAVTSTPDCGYILAVNPGSDEVSLMKKTANGASLSSVVSSRGSTPVSVDVFGDLVYVLNRDVVSGYKIVASGGKNVLQPIPGAVYPLTDPANGSAQVIFTKSGKYLVATEKGTNQVVTWTVNADGTLSKRKSNTSLVPTPFGMVAGNNDIVYVTEADGASPTGSYMSAYKVGANGATLINGVGNGQSAICWVALTKNNKKLVASNTSSNNLSTFNVLANGGVANNKKVAVGTDNQPIDVALSKNDKYLYLLNGLGRSVQSFNLLSNGKLSEIGSLKTPLSANGIAAC